MATEFARSLASVILSLPKVAPFGVVNLTDVAISLMTCLNYRTAAAASRYRRSEPGLVSLAACFIVAFGGTTVTGVLLGQPPSWLAGNTSAPSLLLGYALIYHAPRDAVYRALQHIVPLRRVVEVLQVVSTANCISAWGVEKAVHADHAAAQSSVGLALVAGVFSATGGGMIGAALGVEADVKGGWRLRTPPVLSAPSAGVKTAIAATLVYYAATDPHHHFRVVFDAVGLVPLDLELGTLVVFAIFFILYVWCDVLERGDPFATLTAWIPTLRGGGGGGGSGSGSDAGRDEGGDQASQTPRRSRRISGIRQKRTR